MLEEVVERQNMRAAYQQVKRNAGAPGIDGMSVEELGPHLWEEWQRIKEALLAERYEPQPVKRVEIPKPGGGVRQLRIPTVVDRLIQQARQDGGGDPASYPIARPPAPSTRSNGSNPARRARSAAGALPGTWTRVPLTQAECDDRSPVPDSKPERPGNGNTKARR